MMTNCNFKLFKREIQTYIQKNSESWLEHFSELHFYYITEKSFRQNPLCNMLFPRFYDKMLSLDDSQKSKNMIYLKKFFDNLSLKKVSLIFLIAGFLIYGNALKSPFVMDDEYTVVHNVFISDWKYLPQIFSQSLFAGGDSPCNYWRPLELLSLSLDYHISRLAPLAYHLDSLLWHILAAILLYLVLLKLFENKLASFLTALIFLIHPLQIEAVTFINGRSDPMSAALTFASFLFFWQYANKAPRIKYLAASLFFFILALLAHERSFVLPAILALYLFTLYKNNFLASWKKKIFSLAPFAVIAIIYLVLRLTLLHFGSEFGMLGMSGYTAATLPLAYLHGIAVYAGLLVFPAKLYMERLAGFPTSFFEPSVLIGAALVIASIIIFFLSLKKKKVAAFCVGWFWIFFSISLYALPSMGFLWDHWLYLPMVGFWMPLSLIAVEKIDQTKKSFVRIGIIALITLLLVGFSIRSIIYNAEWNNSVAFFERDIALGGSPMTMYNVLGCAYLQAGRLQDALVAFQKSIATNNQSFEPYYNSGMIYDQLGQPSLAIEMFNVVLEKKPSLMPAYDELQSLYASTGRIDESIAITRKALAINPTDDFMLANLGVLYGDIGDLPNARLYLQEALDLAPQNNDYRQALENINSHKQTAPVQ